MAKRRRKSLGGMQVLKLGGIANAFKGNLPVKQAALGAALGLAGIFVFKQFAAKQEAAGKPLNPQLVKYATLVGAVLGGAAAWAINAKALKNASRGKAQAVGAVLAGGAFFAYQSLASMKDAAGAPKFPFLADMVSLDLRGYSMLVNSQRPGLNSFIVDSPRPMLAEAPNRNLARLAALHDDNDYDGLAALSRMRR